MTRLFVAFVLPPDVCDHLDRCVLDLRALIPGMRWTPKERFHLTLAFLGERRESEVARLVTVVQAFVVPDLQVELAEPGWFRSRGTPRVLWAGVVGATHALVEAHRAFLVAAGESAPREEPWTPHVTLGRVQAARDGSIVDPPRAAAQAVRSRSFSLGPAVLFASERDADGSRYVELARGRVT